MKQILVALLALQTLTTTAHCGEKVHGDQAEAILNNSTAWYLPLSATSARQYFGKGGETDYVDADGGKTFGNWLMRGDQYCSVWPPSDHYSCYDIELSVSAEGNATIKFLSGGKPYEAVLKTGNHLDEVWKAN